ncbi:MAG TPA: M20/M25/M40 family metallo-hydrolase [Vicinamibacterales bacterium]|nr:M20/M25/M40 family metallo-hydrolase [Vicinamibacterales bacterium]
MSGSAFGLLFLLLQSQTAPAPADVRARVDAFTAANQAAIVNELADLLAIPNVAADRANILRNVEFLERAFARRGFTTRRLETPGNPLFFAERATPGATRTTLIYAHVDGQPVDPAAWKQVDPFVPVMRTGRLDAGGALVGDWRARDRFEEDWRLFARSASDDKGPIIAMLAALDALAAAGVQPSTHLKVIIDTEEEASSPNLVPAVKAHRDLLAADMMLIFDGPIHSSGRPTLAFGARGIITGTLTVYGPTSGVHSGNYGNWVPNPALRLSQLIASMKDDEGLVTVEGYYDDVASLTAEERALLDAVPDDSAQVMRTFGIAAPERAGRSLQEGLQEPTLNIRGLSSSFVGSGVRTIIPDRAVAEIDLRLVKETSGKKLMQLIADHVRRQGFHLVDGEPDDATRATYPKIARLRVGSETPAFRTSPLLPESRALAAAMTAAFGAPPVQIRTLGGTVPIAPFVDALNVPAVLLPIVNFDNNQHEENENLRMGHFFKGISILAVALTR